MDTVYLCHISRDEVSLTHSPIDKHRTTINYPPYSKFTNVLIRIEQIYTEKINYGSIEIGLVNKISNNLNDTKIIISNGVSDYCSKIAPNGLYNNITNTSCRLHVFMFSILVGIDN